MASSERNRDIGKCQVCSDTYNAAKRRPRVLFCGHTICTTCIIKSLNERTLLCPSCRLKQFVSHYDKFPVNYELESVLRQLKMSHVIEEESSTSSSSSSSTTSSSASFESPEITPNEMLINMSESLKPFQHALYRDHGVIDNTFKLVGLILERHQSYLDEMRNNHLDRMKVHFHMANLHSEKVETIDNESLKMLAFIDEGEQARERFKSADYNQSITDLESGDAHCIALDSWITNAHQLCQASKTNLSKINIPEMNKLAFFIESKGSLVTAAAIAKTHGAALSDIITLKNQFEKYLKVERILGLLEMDRQILSAKRIIAVQGDVCKLGTRYARLTLDSGRVLLHVLGNPEVLPDGALIVLHKEVIKKVDITSRLVFLDLALKDRTLGRLFIRLCAESIFSDQFSCLCTGELGPSLLDARILSFQSDNHDNVSQYVCFGEHPDSGPKKMGISFQPTDVPFFRDVNWGLEWDKAPPVKTVKAGMVFGFGFGHNCRHFSIETKSDVKGPLGGYFGMVEEGLPYVMEAISSKDHIDDVYVKDCGIVMPW